MRLTTAGLLIFIFAIMSVGQSIYISDQEEGIERDIYNHTETYLSWNYTSYQIPINASSDDFKLISSKRFHNIIDKGVDFLGFITFELGKWSMEFGYNNPQYDFDFFSKFILWWFIAIGLLAIIPLITPILAFIYLLFIGIQKGLFWIVNYAKKGGFSGENKAFDARKL